MQQKIPQEMNVEDKIIGPFTLKQFGFVFVAAVVMVIFMLIFMNLGLGMIPSLIVGAFFGSFSLIVCFVPFNGRPIYTFTFSFLSFLSKPKQRAWKRVDDEKREALRKDIEKQQATGIAAEASFMEKEDLESAEGKIEEISLMVDTGGAYGLPKSVHEPEPTDLFEASSPSVDSAFSQKTEEKEKAETIGKAEVPISEMATVDPKEKFEYEYPDTSNYKIDDVVPGINKEKETLTESEDETEIKRF